MNRNGVIDKPIGFRPDIYVVPGITPYNGGYSLVHANTGTHGKINKWCKWKPVIIDKIFIHLDETINIVSPFVGVGNINVPAAIGTPKRITKRVENIDVNLQILYGLGVPMFINQEGNASLRRQLIDLMNVDESINWEYYPPSGGEHEPSRSSDFLGYDHNADCPITYNVQDAHATHTTQIWCNWASENSAQIDLRELAQYFLPMKFYVFVDIWRYSKTDKAWGWVQTLEFGDMAEGVDIGATLPALNFSQGETEMAAYFFAQGSYQGTYWTMLLPSLPQYANPQTFKWLPSTGDVAETVWMGFDVYSNGTGFAHHHGSAYFESFWNVGEGIYVQLYTTAYYCVRGKLTAPASQQAVIDFADITLVWREFVTGSNSSGQQYATFRPAVYVNGQNVTGTSVTIPAGGSIYVDLELVDLFNPEIIGTANANKLVNGEVYGNIDQMELRYKGVNVTSFQVEVVKVAQGDPHNGYFYSQNEQRFYLTR